MNYLFKEAGLPKDFRKKDSDKIKELIDKSTSFTVVGMPGMGISIFLKFLVTKDFAKFIHVDLYELPELTKPAFFRLLLKNLNKNSDSGEATDIVDLIKDRLVKLSAKNERVVIAFNRFDQMKDSFDTSFFSNIRSLAEVDKEKIVFIFSSNKPLYSWSPNAFKRGNLELYSYNYFLKPYTENELIKLINLYMPDVDISKKLIKLSGGHFQLLQLLKKSDRRRNFLEDDFINLQIKRIFTESLNHAQRQQVKKIVSSKGAKNLDQYLLKLGVAKSEKNNSYSLFSPLLKDYIARKNKHTLTKLESKLFKLLKENQDKIVSKNELFETLWPNNPDKQSDWALNSLVYRLRKNLAFNSEEYTITNHKKRGYVLTKI